MPINDTKNPTKNVVDFDELYPARFLKAGQLKGKPVTLTISKVWSEELEGDAGKKWRGIVAFEKTDSQLVLNRTNGTCLREMFGRDVTQWIGKRVTLFPGEWNGEPCIRVWGSPELDRDRTITIQLPRRKPQTMVMHAVRPTNGKGAPAAPAASKPAEAPHDEETGEVYERAEADPF